MRIVVYEEQKAKFHGWFNQSYKTAQGMGLEIVAVIELEDGSIKIVDPTRIRFL